MSSPDLAGGAFVGMRLDGKGATAISAASPPAGCGSGGPEKKP